MSPRRLEVSPRRGAGLAEGDRWTGPEALVTAAGSEVVRDDATRTVLALERAG